ncbi:MAG: DegT/DnrJ/EryC1/StrS aminotransferase family protein [Rhodospirillales bacterium]|nr:DegT/DnrJ/EryC1/StrS aminotransferase family protein [Rhodospirillales bacterium]
MSIPRLHLPLAPSEIAAFLARLALPDGFGRGVVEEFERRFAALFDRHHAIAFCRARSALYHLLQCLDLPPGSDVAISGLHVADFVNMIRLAGFRPVVVDLEADSYSIDMADLAAKTGAKTSCLLVTPLSGHSPDLARLAAFAKERQLVLIEDCSQAFSTEFQGRRAGSFGRAAIYSLSLLKSVSTMRGGVVTTDDAHLAERLRGRAAKAGKASRLSLAGEAIKQAVIALATWRPLFSLVVLPLLRVTSGLNDLFSRFQKSNRTVSLRASMPKAFLEAFSWPQAALGLGQLASFERREKRRIDLAVALRGAILPARGFSLPRLTEGSRNCWWLFPLLTDHPAALKAHLARHGIDSAPMLLSALASEEAFLAMGFKAPNAERLKARTLFVPLHEAMSGDDVERVAAALLAFQSPTAPKGP